MLKGAEVPPSRADVHSPTTASCARIAAASSGSARAPGRRLRHTRFQVAAAATLRQTRAVKRLVLAAEALRDVRALLLDDKWDDAERVLRRRALHKLATPADVRADDANGDERDMRPARRPLSTARLARHKRHELPGARRELCPGARRSDERDPPRRGVSAVGVRVLRRVE